MTQIGKNIKKIRNVRGLSQQAFAEMFQLTRGNISSYEEFRAEPKIEVIVNIANNFGIPLEDFIKKELTVNELLHYNTRLVVETEKLKITQNLTSVLFVPALYLSDYIIMYRDDEFVSQLPRIIVPSNSKFELLAIEIVDSENLPAGYDYKNGDIIILEKVMKENIHRIVGKLGIMIDTEGLKAGIFQENDNGINLSLNNWIEYSFDIESEAAYWVLKAVYMNQ